MLGCRQTHHITSLPSALIFHNLVLAGINHFHSFNVSCVAEALAKNAYLLSNKREREP